MRFLFYLILLSCIFVEYSLTINDTDYIQCTSRCSQITVSFSDALSFPPDCQENNNNDITNIYDDALACGIDYVINYDTNEIQINFYATNNTGSLEDQKPAEFLVQTITLGLSRSIQHSNVITRKYGCNTENDCARKHYFNSINYFLNEGIDQLELIRIKLHNDSLLMGSGSRRRCIDSNIQGDRPSIKCPDGLCYADFENFQLDDQRNRKIQSCDHENKPFLFSEIEHHTPKSTEKERNLLQYKCNKNVCNRDDFIHRLQPLINDYMTGPSKNVDEKTIIIEKKENLSNKQTISSYILVLFLFLFHLFI